MHATLSLALAGTAMLAAAAPVERRVDGILGFDISHYQANFDYAGARAAGAGWGLIKATEGTDYIDPSFATHSQGCAANGILWGAYHFAQPASTSGADQANYFVANGGNWTNDGKTLPGMLDIEYNPSGDKCYGLTPAAMTAWIADFVNTYQKATTRYPIIYSTLDWWSTCTGNAPDFGATCPLDLAKYSDSIGTLPAGWTAATMWQYSDSYQFGGDADTFLGSQEQLQQLASGPPPAPPSNATRKFSHPH